MKKILGLFMIALTAWTFQSCGDADTDNPYAVESTISVESADLAFPYTGGTGYVKLTAPNGITDIKYTPTWISHSLSGTTVTVSVQPNDSLENRYARMTFYSGKDSVYVVVHQFGNSGKADSSD